MSACIEMTGKQFGRLTALRFHSVKRGQTLWEFKCSCGVQCVKNGYSVRKGFTRSCGCLWDEMSQAGKLAETHGMCGSVEHKLWERMRRRCEQKSDPSYRDYGARGIRVCKRWLKFINFFQDMGKRPAASMTLGRKRNNGNYTPKNCRWEDVYQQANNTRSNHRISFNGKTQTLTLWALEVGIRPVTLRARIRVLGWPIKRALTEGLHLEFSHPTTNVTEKRVLEHRERMELKQ